MIPNEAKNVFREIITNEMFEMKPPTRGHYGGDASKLRRKGGEPI